MTNIEENSAESEVIAKGKEYAKITFIVIGVITILLILGFAIFIIFINNAFKYNETYYLLKVNDSNRNIIIELLKENNNEYCESMDKIEYVYSFPHAKSLIIYCEDNTSINLYESNDKLIDFVRINGKEGER